MLQARTCIWSESNGIKYTDGRILPSISYGNSSQELSVKCSDCNVSIGGCHHPGCDLEICPNCGGQLIDCDCLNEDAINNIIQNFKDLIK